MTLAHSDDMTTELGQGELCTVEHLPHITPKQIKQYDVAGPRYTSYPTADRFVEAFTEDAYIQALSQRRINGWANPLSIYVHIPFCESLCFYCACNKIITKQHKKVPNIYAF